MPDTHLDLAHLHSTGRPNLLPDGTRLLGDQADYGYWCDVMRRPLVPGYGHIAINRRKWAVDAHDPLGRFALAHAAGWLVYACLMTNEARASFGPFDRRHCFWHVTYGTGATVTLFDRNCKPLAWWPSLDESTDPPTTVGPADRLRFLTGKRKIDDAVAIVVVMEHLCAQLARSGAKTVENEGE